MTAPTDVKRKRLTDKMLPLNYRIVLAKGWTWQDDKWFAWHDSKGRLDTPADFVGTLEGVSGMLRELNERAVKAGNLWYWYFHPCSLVRYRCRLRMLATGQFVGYGFSSSKDRPGDCVGDAWLSVFGKEAIDANTD